MASFHRGAGQHFFTDRSAQKVLTPGNGSVKV
jgi:hypothetical protein